MYLDINNLVSIFSILLWSIYYGATVVVALYFPGLVILRKFGMQTSIFRSIVISIGIGLTLWIIQGLIFGYLHVRWLSYIYLGIFVYASRNEFLHFTIQVKKLIHSIRSFPKYIIIVGFIGLIGQTIQSIPSGFIFPRGWFTFIADDSLYHLGLTGALIQNFPPFQPGLSNIPLTNYHYLSNLFVAEFVRVFHLPIFATQFLFTYILFSFLLGAVSYIFFRLLRISRLGSTIGVYLLYFSSDLIYLTIWITTGKLNFMMHPMEDGTMFLENPPRALATILTLLGLVIYQHSEKKATYWWKILVGVIFGLTIGVKVHTGIMVFFGLAIVGVVNLVFRKWSSLITPLVALGVGLAVYLPTNISAGLPIFSPFEIAHNFIVQPALNLSWMELRRRIYLDHGNWIRITQMEISIFFVFMMSQFGIRNFGWFGISELIKKKEKNITLLIIGGLVSILIFGSTFLQPLTIGDTFNFYVAGSLFLCLLLVVFIGKLIQINYYMRICVILIVFCATFPRWTYRMASFLAAIHNAEPTISRNEFNAFDAIKNDADSDAVIAVYNIGHFDAYFAYICALTDKQTYLSGIKILNDRKFDYANRSRNLLELVSQTDEEKLRKIYNDEHIKYLIVYSDSKISIQNRRMLSEFYRNNDILVYKYIKE